MNGDALLDVRDVHKSYAVRGSRRESVRAVDGVSLSLQRGEVLGVVGESGCGKSTLGRLLVHLEEPDSGSIILDGVEYGTRGGRSRRDLRRKIQLVFQDPHSALNPRLTVGSTLDEVLKVHGLGGTETGRGGRVRELLSLVGLEPEEFVGRYPHQMSGGQRQRVGIARALAVEPEILVLDEPISALDVSVQSGVMNLLQSLRTSLGLSYVFISHDLGMVRHVSDRVAVMYLGRIVELGPWQPVSDQPLHPYTRALHAAVPVADPAMEAVRAVAPLQGEVPDPANPPSGCSFHPRCPLAADLCRVEDPPLDALDDGHLAACHAAAGRLNAMVERPAS